MRRLERRRAQMAPAAFCFVEQAKTFDNDAAMEEQ